MGMPFLFNLVYILCLEWLFICIPSVVEPCGIASLMDMIKMYLADSDEDYKCYL